MLSTIPPVHDLPSCSRLTGIKVHTCTTEIYYQQQNKGAEISVKDQISGEFSYLIVGI